MRRRLCVSAFALPLLISACVSAQNVFVLPAQSGSITPTVFSADPFNQTAVLPGAGFASTFAFAGPGGKFYLVSNTSSGTIQVMDSTFASLRTVANVVGVITAAMTPDAKHLFEVSSGGVLNILDTSTDTLSATGVYYGGAIIDLTPSIDSTKGYAIVSLPFGFSVVVFDARTGATINTVTLGAASNATGVSVAQNGLVYVSTNAAVLELDPNTYSVRRTTTVVGRPGKLSFTTDGKTGLAVNLNPVTGTAAYEFDMATRTLRNSIPQTALPTGITINQIVPVGNNRAIAYSSSSLTLYDIALDSLNLAPYAFASGGGVSSVAASNTLPAGANLNTQFLFFTIGGTIFRADLNANQITGQLALSGTAGATSFAASGVTNGTPAAILTYGDNQSIAPNVTSAPLVVKVIDATGRPLTGVQVTFGSTGVGVTISKPVASTDTLGNAVTTVSAATTQTVTVNVTAGTLTTAFTVNIGTVGTGGGPGGGLGGIFIVSGQGEIIDEQQRTNAADGTSMVVQLNDSTGTPIQGATIVFTFQSGSGTVVDNNGGNIGVTQTLNETTTTCTASSPQPCFPGQASVDFLANSVPTFPPAFLQASVTATASDGTTVTFYITTVPLPNTFQAQVEVHQPTRGVPIVAQAGQTIKGAIQAVVSSAVATPIPNVGLVIQNVDPTKPAPAKCAGGIPLGDPNGFITCDLVATAAPGTYQFNIVVGGTRTIGVYNLTITPGAPTNVAILSGDKQSGNPGQKLVQPLLIQVTDAAGNPSPNVPVSWTVTPLASATLSNVSSTTDAQGKASAVVTFSNGAAGGVQVQANAGSLSAVIFNVTATVPIASIQLVSGSGQSAAVNAPFAAPVVVKVVDANGKGIPGVLVTFAATNGASVGANNTVTTDANGNASITVTAGPNAGTIVVTASAGGLLSPPATLTAIPPGPTSIVFLNGASLQRGVFSAGGIVAIQGQGLVPVPGVFSAENVLGPLPTNFQGITVTFNGIAAPIFSVSNVNGVQQVVVQVPYEIGNVSSVTVVITTASGGATTITNVAVQPYAPGIFETTVFGAKQAVAVHAADGSYVTPSSPARRGENIIVYVTGLGQTSPPTGTNRAGTGGQNVLAPIVAGINGGGVPVVSSQLVPGLIAVYSITMTIPADAPSGLINVNVIAYDAVNNPYFAQGSLLPIQ
jgi:uncharacterized protein (TIGR03437 family)